jgi:VWFA-related protein
MSGFQAGAIPRFVCLLGMLGATGWLATSARPQEPPPDSFRYRIDVQLVLLSASVTTAAGRPVTDLDEGAFEVYEDGKLRPIKLFERKTALPLQLVLMVDASLSAVSKLPAEKEAMARFIHRVLLPADVAALYELSGKSKPVVEFSRDVKQLEAGLTLIEERAGTALYDAIVEVASKLKEREGRRVMVIRERTQRARRARADDLRRPERRTGLLYRPRRGARPFL